LSGRICLIGGSKKNQGVAKKYGKVKKIFQQLHLHQQRRKGKRIGDNVRGTKWEEKIKKLKRENRPQKLPERKQTICQKDRVRSLPRGANGHVRKSSKKVGEKNVNRDPRRSERALVTGKTGEKRERKAQEF